MRKIHINIDKKLLSNTFFLYLLTFSTQLCSLVTVPYLTRVLGAVAYGKTGIALAYMSYVTIIMDLGFILSATQKVVEHKNDKKYIEELLFSVTVAKIGLGILVTIIFGIYVSFNSSMNNDFGFYMLYLAAYIINAFLPDFFYRGIEKMKVITYRTLLIKIVFMCLTFLFIKKESDYYKVPLMNLLGNTMAVLVTYFDLWKNYKIVMRKVQLSSLLIHIKETLPFFVSRIASTVYQALNTIILSYIYGSSAMLGYYTSADKIVSLSKTSASPIADSMYPYMIREKNFRLVKKLLFIVMPIIMVGAIVLFIFANPICIFLFGEEYGFAGNILRCLLPIMVVILPTYILCFPVMVPMGLSKYANFSNVIGMIIQLCGLIVLFILGKLNIYSICILSSIAEVSVFLYRLIIVLVNKNRCSKESGEFK